MITHSLDWRAHWALHASAGVVESPPERPVDPFSLDSMFRALEERKHARWVTDHPAIMPSWLFDVPQSSLD